jgi:chromatin remodeling complex protein RSC6
MPKKTKTSVTTKTKAKKNTNKKPRTNKTAAKQTVAKVVEKKATPVVQKATVVNEPSVESTQNPVSEILSKLTSVCVEAASKQKLLTQSLKTFTRTYKKELKELEKNRNRSRRQNKKDPNRPKRAPSGFAVPSKISQDMCSFLGLTQGTELSRTDVTRKLTAYIRDKKLQVPHNRRSFKPDKALGSILGPLQEVDKEKGYTYFNLQRYITPHIISKSKASIAASK